MARDDGKDRNPRLPTDGQREALMLRAAKLFYRLDRTQTEIADELGLTRWQVSRLLSDARDGGVVHIEIRPRLRRLPETEAQLQDRFGLRDCVVLRFEGTEATLAEAVCRAAADYLTALQPKPAVIGVSWGRTMAAVARHLCDGWAPGVHVVQVNGAVSLRPGLAGTNSVAEDFARVAPGEATMMPAPAILGSSRSREVLEQDRIVSDVMRRAETAEMLVFTMGALSLDSVHVASGYIGPDDVDALLARGAVGDILGRFVDDGGRIVDPEIDARTLGLPLSRLPQMPLTLGVVSGQAKHRVALAALRASYVNVMITDEATACHALEHSHAA